MTTETIKRSRKEYLRQYRLDHVEHRRKWERDYRKDYALGIRRGPRKIPLEERFNAKWIPEPYSGCWLWTASVDPMWKYGCILVNGKPERAHRVSWRLYRGEIPAGICVLHQCDTPECVNPDHLFLGTTQDNTIDMLKKGRGGKKLTVQQVLAIREDKRRPYLIAKDYGIHQGNVTAIQNKTQWRYV